MGTVASARGQCGQGSMAACSGRPCPGQLPPPVIADGMSCRPCRGRAGLSTRHLVATDGGCCLVTMATTRRLATWSSSATTGLKDITILN